METQSESHCSKSQEPWFLDTEGWLRIHGCLHTKSQQTVLTSGCLYADSEY